MYNTVIFFGAKIYLAWRQLNLKIRSFVAFHFWSFLDFLFSAEYAENHVYKCLKRGQSLNTCITSASSGT